MKLNRGVFLLFCLHMAFVSCIPNEKVIYLQNQDTFREGVSNQVTSTHKLKKEPFRIHSGNILSIEIGSLTSEEFNFYNEVTQIQRDPLLDGFIVDEVGEIFLPVVGKIKLGGLTLPEAESLIKDKVALMVAYPTVSVKLLNFKFTVLGEVNRPGDYISYDPDVDFFEAIGMAGDMTEFADRAKIQIVRYSDDEAQIKYVNVLEEEFLRSPYLYLKPNDLILVSPMKVKNFKRYQMANLGIILSAVTAISLLLIRVN